MCFACVYVRDAPHVVHACRFFNARIDFEEELLASKDFFGAKYTEYKRVTPTYIPLIQ